MALKGSGKGGSMEIKLDVKFKGVSKPKRWTARENPIELQNKLDEGRNKSGVFTFTSAQGKLVDIFLRKVQYIERETGVGEGEKKQPPVESEPTTLGFPKKKNVSSESTIQGKEK